MLLAILRRFFPIGLLQGIALWGLKETYDAHHWPSSNPILFGTLLWPIVALPLARYLSETNEMPAKRRQLFLILIALCYGLMGAYAGWIATPLSIEPWHASGEKIIPASFSYVVAALIAGFISVPLFAAWNNSKKQFDYAVLFNLSWRNGLLCVSVGALTGLFWAVLFAGALLMKSIGLEFVYDIIEKPLFIYPATASVIAIIFANGIARATLLDSLRRFWLALNAWLLPLLLLFSVMWVFALPFTGLNTLFATKQAAFYLLWFCVLAVKFINSAWQDGESVTPFPAWLAAAIRFIWPSMMLVAGVALWALAKRIAQYGWTEDRIWACFIALLALIYTCGYSLSLLPRLRPRWMTTIAQSNITVAIVAITCLMLFNSPLADPRRLAVNSQIDRLNNGHVNASEFDYAYLRWDAGRWGLLALTELSQKKNNANERAIASRATQLLARKERWEYQPSPSSDEAAFARLMIYPTTEKMDAALSLALHNSAPQYWQIKSCLDLQNQCIAWFYDVDNNGSKEVILISGNANACCAQALVLERKQTNWVPAAQISGTSSLADWQLAMDKGTLTTSPPRWPDIMINDRRLPLSNIEH